MNEEQVRQALKKVAKAVDDLADAFGDSAARPDPWARDKEMIQEWSSRGLNAAEASALCARHGFPGQKVSAWCRGDWAEVRDDGKRYLTERTWRWMEDEGFPRPAA